MSHFKAHIWCVYLIERLFCLICVKIIITQNLHSEKIKMFLNIFISCLRGSPRNCSTCDSVPELSFPEATGFQNSLNVCIIINFLNESFVLKVIRVFQFNQRHHHESSFVDITVGHNKIPNYSINHTYFSSLFIYPVSYIEY